MHQLILLMKSVLVSYPAGSPQKSIVVDAGPLEPLASPSAGSTSMYYVHLNRISQVCGRRATMAGRRVGPHELVALQEKQEGIRNVCILAHVDHGKTT
jgi:hypothetical protein